MTNEEALEILCNGCPYSYSNTEKRLLEAIDKAIEIMEGKMTNQEAIEHLKNIVIFSFQDGYTDESRKALDMAIEALQNFPTQMSGTSDLISRQTALHTITSYNGVVDKSVAKRLLIQLPSAQPEIIHCKDCRFCD